MTPDRPDMGEKDDSGLERDVEQVLRDLDAPHGRLPVEAIRAAQRLRERIVPGLIALIRRATQEAREGRDPETDGHFLALFLLTEFRASEAWPAILEAMSLPEDRPYDLYDDAILEALPQAVAVMAHDRVEEILSFIRNPEVCRSVRWAFMSGLALCVVTGTHSRDEIVRLLRDLLREAIEQEDSENTMGLVHTLMELYPEEAYEEIQEAFKAGLVEKLFIHMRDIDEQMSRGREAALEALAREYPPIEDTVENLRTWACYCPREERSTSARIILPPVPPPPLNTDASLAERSLPRRRIGRNDPCPCGSGKKFKKCCGRQGQ